MNNIEDIKKRYTEEISLDKPIKININGSSLYLNSVLMKDYYRFVVYSDVLNINKNSINDPKIISMSYMDFLINLILYADEKQQNYIYVSLYNIFSIVTKNDDIKFSVDLDDNKKPCFKIDDIIIKKNDFDFIRKVIMVQNIPSYKEEYIDPVLKEDLEKTRMLNSGGRQQVDIEHKITFLSMVSGVTLADIYNMPIRKFMIMLEMESKYTSYKIYKQAQLSGMVEFKGEIPHYMDEMEQSIGIDYDSFKNKINNS